MTQTKKQEKPATPRVKTLDLKSRTFTANGNKYTILDTMPLSRWRIFNKLQPRLTFGCDFKSLFENLNKAYRYLDTPKPQPASSAIVIHNIMNGLNDVADDSREEPALLICALFIVRDGEDVGAYDEAACIEKIRDWEKEGYDANGFFHLALISIPAFRTTFEEFINRANSQTEA